MAALFAGVAAMNTVMVGASTAGSLIAAERAGAGFSGLPNAAGVLGTASGALIAATLVSRRGSRFGLVTLYALATGGGLVAFGGAVTGTLALLLAGMALLGLGNGAAQLSRYVAAELYPEQRRATGLSLIVLAGTVGALAGPALLAPTSHLAGLLALPELSGPVGLAVVVTAVAVLAAAALPRTAATTPAGVRPAFSLADTGRALRSRVVLTPLVAMVAAQVCMVAVMTMTPLQLHEHGHGLDGVGWVLGAHMIGMFALAPLSGRIADRWGGRATIYAGIGTLAVASATAIAAPTAHATGLPVALFLLGYGWNLVFVGGSGLLSRDLPAAERTRLQGIVDALVWSASAVASLGAGQLFGVGGFVLVTAVAGTLALLPLALLVSRSRPARRSP
ncbi:putative MFS family arabinose efflux permease [Prauserella shujinwangii]|uniref:Putative MFS family arabinose efflux permease n=2 Tax=Prauserella shujinwangii TaxID=1453103 RepID=A0A2T0LQ28_9PSEU|nr:putative MFS family arabinose efflux permease [Prauserella shujinwangii]